MESNNAGFTLLELLVVISIIGLISSIILAQIHVAEYKARDSVRFTNINTLINALSLYYQDNGRFPCQALRDGTTPSNSQESDFLQPLVGKYLAKTPLDPENNSYPIEYATFKSSPNGGCGQIAHLGIWLENTTSCPDDGVLDPGDPIINATGYHVHCHYFIPQGLSAPCPNPFWLTGLPWPGSAGTYNGVSYPKNSCTNLIESVATDDY